MICGNRGKGKKLFFTGKKVFSLSPGPPIPFSKKAGYLVRGNADPSGVLCAGSMRVFGKLPSNLNELADSGTAENQTAMDKFILTAFFTEFDNHINVVIAPRFQCMYRFPV